MRLAAEQREPRQMYWIKAKGYIGLCVILFHKICLSDSGGGGGEESNKMKIGYLYVCDPTKKHTSFRKLENTTL